MINLSIGLDYPTAKARQFELDPRNYTTTLLTDLTYFGYCAEIDFTALRQYMQSKGDISDVDIDFDYSAMFWIKVMLLKVTFK